MQEKKKLLNLIKQIIFISSIAFVIILVQLAVSRFIINKNDEIELYFYEYRIDSSEIVISSENYTGEELSVEIITEKEGLSIQYQLGDNRRMD